MTTPRDPQHSGRNASVWMHSDAVPSFEPLTTDTSADVVIVGGGMAGLSTAYHLGQAGKSVVLLESGALGSGETERTTAHLASAMDDRFVELARMHGVEGARLAAESHAAAISLIEEVSRREGILCEFQRLDGYLIPAQPEHRRLIRDEFDAAQRAGLVGVQLDETGPIAGFESGPALRFPNQAQFDPLRYLRGLAEAVVRDGGRIFAHTRVASIEDGSPAQVVTATGHRVRAGAVVVATNSPVNDRLAIHTKQAPYRTYVIAATIDTRATPRALIWDTDDPYHYVRLQHGREGEDLLIVGGEDHKTGQADDAGARYTRLEMWTRARFPIGEIRHRWSGQVMEPADGLGFIGRNPGGPRNLFLATGDSGQGMTHGTIAGRLLTDLILGRENPWAALYDPARPATSAVGEYARENLNATAQYTDWIMPGTARSTDDIAPDSGAILRRGLTKSAVYRDAAGQLHECSAVCPHLGGIVHWNHDEKIWECPVHGSRFGPAGNVLNGPAISDLAPTGDAAPQESRSRSANEPDS